MRGAAFAYDNELATRRNRERLTVTACMETMLLLWLLVLHFGAFLLPMAMLATFEALAFEFSNSTAASATRTTP